MHTFEPLAMAPPARSSQELFSFPAQPQPEACLPTPQLQHDEEVFLMQTIREVDTLALKGTAFLLMILTLLGLAATLIWGR